MRYNRSSGRSTELLTIAVQVVVNINVAFFTFSQLDADNYLKEGKFQQIREERFYNYEDVCEMHPDKMPKLEEWVRSDMRSQTIH